jgi:cyclopropane-fatty-acyl-phospholipid synthase
MGAARGAAIVTSAEDTWTMFARLLKQTLSALAGPHALQLILADGDRIVVGQGAPEVVLRFHDAAAPRALALDPDLKLGELFTDGRLSVEKGKIYDFLDITFGGMENTRPSWLAPMSDRLRFATRRLMQRNGLMRSRANVAHHYDIGDDLYALFLDSDWQYSCAYFEHPGVSLDEAQLAKKRHIAAKLCLKEGQSALDIGCGWGGMALYLAEVAGAGRVEGITLSERQIARARRRAQASPAARKLHFELLDYRRAGGVYDRIVSVGMFEHVGLGQYDAFFAKCRALLAEDGVMLLHSIVNTGPPAFTNPWIARYIFPGGYIPSLSEVLPAIERAGLIVTDVELLRLHYAETLRHWRERFMARRERARALYDERFCRMWEFYLAGSEASFRHQMLNVAQIQIARRQNAAPLTRDYIGPAEARLRRAELPSPEAPR